MSGLYAVLYFLFAIFFSLLSFVLWARIALRFFHVSSLHPVSQAILALTNPIITPVNRIFTAKKTRLSRYDWAAFSVLVLIEIIKFFLIGALFLTALLPWGLLLLYVVADVIVEPCNLLFYAVIIRVVMSWVNPRWHHPLADVLRLITEPLLKFGRRIIPNISGFDFSPIAVLALLKIITLFISASLPLHLI